MSKWFNRLSKKRKKKRDTYFRIDTFTKVWVNRNMILSWVCIFWCFILATIGREQVAENLAVAIVINIVGVFVGYFAKSFLETREEKRMDSSKDSCVDVNSINPPNSVENDVNHNDFIDV